MIFDHRDESLRSCIYNSFFHQIYISIFLLYIQISLKTKQERLRQIAAKQTVKREQKTGIKEEGILVQH